LRNFTFCVSATVKKIVLPLVAYFRVGSYEGVNAVMVLYLYCQIYMYSSTMKSIIIYWINDKLIYVTS